jgi:hypothetical protein
MMKTSSASLSYLSALIPPLNAALKSQSPPESVTHYASLGLDDILIELFGELLE